MKAVVDRALLDTNVLLAATDEGRSEHDKARAALDSWPASGTAIYTSGQILREYLVVATRPESQNGLGLRLADALANSKALRARLLLLDEHRKVADGLEELLENVECSGKQIHDANVVATMIAHGLSTIVTSNVADFRRFASYITVIDVRET